MNPFKKNSDPINVKFDEKKLVQLVKRRRILYDKTVKTNRKKQVVCECWLEITREMTKNFNDLTKEEQTKASRLSRQYQLTCNFYIIHNNN